MRSPTRLKSRPFTLISVKCDLPPGMKSEGRMAGFNHRDTKIQGLRVLVSLGFLMFMRAATCIAQDNSQLDLKSIPVAEWLNAGETTQIPWTLIVGNPYLRMDQRIEVGYFARIRAKDLNRTGSDHDLFLLSRISTPDGEWLNAPGVMQTRIEQELPKNT